MFGIFKKSSSLDRLLLLSALPDNKDSFVKLLSNESSDFIRSLSTNGDPWGKYASAASELQSLFKTIEKRGGTVIRNFRLDDLRRISDFDIVVVFAHHSNNADEIEIGGRMVRTQDFVDSIPVDAEVFLDLTSCYSSSLIPKVKSHIPKSQIIGISSATSLSFRIFLLKTILQHLSKHTEDNYLEAVKAVLASVRGANDAANPATHNDKDIIKLGGKLQSTVFAPNIAHPGEDFIVSIFLHRQEDYDEVELIAKSIDEDAEKKASKLLGLKIVKGDSVDFQFCISKQMSVDFGVDKARKGFIWDGDINDVEFVVSVSRDCTLSSFVGKILIAVNKKPAGDIVFKTHISNSMEAKNQTSCAPIDFNRYDQQRIAAEATEALTAVLSDKINSMSSAESSDSKELEMYKKCLELLTEPHPMSESKTKRVFISSTSDMKPFRDIVKERVCACEMYPDMYENWGQGNFYPRDLCCEHVLKSDIFVIILGKNYGFVEPLWNKSMTEIEYRIAQMRDIPIVIFIQDNYMETDEHPTQCSNHERQEKFIDELRYNRVVGFFSNEFNLAMLANSELLSAKYSKKK